jgi:predicted nucleic acid-binding Zn ribbon protein
VRRLAPRRLDPALGGLLDDLRPATTLARVQEAWPGAVGPGVSTEAAPVSERRGTVTVSCGSSVWAQELQMMSTQLLTSLNGALRQSGGAPEVHSLRFVAAGLPGRARRRR